MRFFSPQGCGLKVCVITHKTKNILIWLSIIVLTCLVSIFTIPQTTNAYQFAENWTIKDTSYQITFSAVTMIDFAQTRWMARQDWTWGGRRYHEICPLLFSRHPHEDATWLIPVGIIAHSLISMALPPSYQIFGYDITPRRTWQILGITLEAVAVGNNIVIGTHIEF